MLSPLWIRSPQQLVADAQPPGLTTLTAPVERRVLRDLLVVRGEVKAGRSFAVTPAARTGSQAVVTAVPVKQGDQVPAGRVVAEVSGRPLVVLPGATPAYRDIKPGASGKDVQQLQAALAGLGHEPREHDGVFGPGTKRALAAFYNSLGYDPVPAGEGDDERLAGLCRQVTTAERAVADGQEAVAALAADPLATDKQRTSAEKALNRAKEDLALARDEYAKAQRVSGPMLPISEYVFLPVFPARVDSLQAMLGGPVASPLITLSTGAPVVVAILTAAQVAVCKPGASAEISSNGGLHGTGSITEVGAAAPTSAGGQGAGSATAAFTAVITPSPALDANSIGQNVLVKIEVAVSEGVQIVVPVSALYAAGDGRVRVNRVVSEGKVEQVEVEAGLSAEGYVEVTPTSGELHEGDLVTIGQAAP